jgi:SNF2 family DNA or RNA helicase
MRKSDLKRTVNIFEDFKFNDEPEVVTPPENALKFRKLAHDAAVHSLLSDDDIGNARVQPQKSLSKSESSQDSPWLEKRNVYDISDAAKAQNIARAQEQRRRQARNEPVNLPSTHKFQKYLEESGEVTRFRDDIPKTNNLDRILSKSNLIRSSLLNKNLEDLEEFDPLDKARNKANKQKEMERKERLQNRENIHQNGNSSSVARKQKRFSLDDDTDEEQEEASNFIRPQQQQKRKAKNTIVLDDDDDDEFEDNEEEVDDRLEDSFQLEDTPQQEGKSFQKLSKKGGIHQQQQKRSKAQQPIFLSDSDEDKQPKKQQKQPSKKSKKASKAESSEDEFRDANNNEEDEDDGGDGNNWQDEELSEYELKQKAFAIITQCENLAKNLKSSLLKWESKANQHKEHNNNSQLITSPANNITVVVSTTTVPVVQSKMKDCVNLIDIGDDDDDDDNDNEGSDEEGGEEDEDYHHEGTKKRATASSGLLMNTPTHNNNSHQDSAHHAKHHSKLINNAEIHSLCPELTLNSYQLVGVNWMRLLYQNNMNGVLADDMGLGKTIQTIAFLTYLSKSSYLPKSSEKYRLPHLIIVPASVLSNWENEFHKFAPSMTLLKYHGTQNERNELKYQIKSMVKNGELNVLLTNYTIFERESSKNDRAFLLSLSFHFIVLDEAHSIKNINSSRYLHINNLQSYNRLLLSGTPVQNNIMELLSLLSFLMPKIFVKENCELLVHVFGWDNNGSGKRNNSNNNNSDRLNELKSILFPFVLRRLKSDVLNQLTEKKIVTVKLPLTDYQRKVYDQMIEQFMAKKRQTEMDMLKQKEIDERNEIKVNTKKKLKKSNGLALVSSPVSKQQQEVEEIIDLSETPIQKMKDTKTTRKTEERNIVNLEKSSNSEIVKLDDDFFSSSDILTTSAAKHLFTALRKVCNHPLLLRLQYNSKDIEKIANIALQEEYFGKQCSLQQVIQEMTGKFSDYDIHQLCLLYSYSLSSLILNEENLFQCNKINYLKELLPSLVQDDHRVLLFSQWTKILDILEILMNYLNYQFVRLDGSTPIKERQEIIDEFNENQEIKVFLLSTKAGGLGINLTSADTVVLHDLDYNPENDRQAEVHKKQFPSNFSYSLSLLGSLSSHWTDQTRDCL